MKEFSTGICANCGAKREDHYPEVHGLYCHEIHVPDFTFFDTGLVQIQDNAVRVLRAAKELSESYNGLNSRLKLGIPLALTYAIEKLEEAIDASTKRA